MPRKRQRRTRRIRQTGGRNIRIRTSRGLLDATLYLPKRRKIADVGMVLFLPGRTDDHHQHWYHQLYAALVRKHMGVLGLSLNGHGRSYGSFGQFRYQRELKDAQAAIQWLRRKGARRIGVSGFSQGGGVAILVTAQDPTIKGAALVAPVTFPRVVHETLLSDAERAFLATHSYVDVHGSDGHIRRVQRGFFTENAASPSYLPEAERIHSPVLILHGTRDEAVPLYQSKRFYASVASEASLKQIVPVLGADHTFSGNVQRRTMIRALQNFLAYYVGRDRMDIVKAAILHQGKLLLLKRSGTVAYDPGLWDMPSGHMEPGENPDRKVLEEVEEESGIPRAYLRILRRTLHTSYSARHDITFRIHLYLIDSGIGRTKLNWENTGAIWALPSRLPSRTLRPYTKVLLRALGVV